MNQDLLRYKIRFLTCLLLFSYVYLHLHLTGIYEGAPLEQLIDFSVRLPFGQRLLVPFMARSLHTFLSLNVRDSFFILEFLFVSLLYIAMKRVLQQEFSSRSAMCLSWLFLLLLPLVTVINYGYLTVGNKLPIYFTYDTATLFFMTAGFGLCLRSKWFFFILLIILATLNRESSILLVLLVPLVHWSHLKQVLKPFSLALIAYLLSRGFVLFCIRYLPGDLMEWYYRRSEYTHFEKNLYFLFNNNDIFLFIYSMAGLPLFWFTFYDYIPSKYRPIRYLALFYFLGLLLVANIFETRIYGEIIVLLYLPVCVAVSRWLKQEAPAVEKAKGTLFYLNRYFILGILILIVLSRQVILSVHGPWTK